MTINRSFENITTIRQCINGFRENKKVNETHHYPLTSDFRVYELK